MATSAPVLEMLDNLKKLDLTKYPYEEARAIMQKAHDAGVVLDIVEIMLKPGQIVGRIRPNNKGQRFENKCELTYVPRHINKTYQRASRPDQTMFYGCVEHPPKLGTDYYYADQEPRIVCAKEMYDWFRTDDLITTNYQLVTYSRWQVVKPIIVYAVILESQFYDRHLLTMELVNAFRQHLNTIPARKDDSLAISEFFASQFSNAEPNSKKSYLYTLSALFAAMAIKNNHDGVMYPSVRANGMSQNIAITPEAADNCLSLYSVTEMSLYKYKKHWAIDNEYGSGVAPNQTSFHLQQLVGDKHIGMNEIFHELNYLQKLYYKVFIKKDYKKFFKID